MRKFNLLVLVLSLFTTGATMAADTNMKTAIFAGGCFWCMEPQFVNMGGVSDVTSGYIGGHVKNPTYEQVSAGGTGHLEAIRVIYDPAKVTYEKLLETFWQNIDPLDEHGQFCDKGSQYLAGIFTTDDEQKKLAEASREEVAKLFGKPIATVIKPATEFYAAEDYHQKFYINNRDHYKRYRLGCGRDADLERLWKGKSLQ